MKPLVWLVSITTLIGSLWWQFDFMRLRTPYRFLPVKVVQKVKEKEMDYTHFRSVELAVDNIMQEPELPTGCEITALTIVLNYMGYNVDKLTMADKYLPQGEVGKTHPDEAFIGNPRNARSYGANAPVLIKAANKYFDDVLATHKIYDVSTEDFDSLLEYINDGFPVIIWATINMKASYPTTKWIINGETVQWTSPFHCMVLIGYTEDTYIIADPLQGIVEYDKDLVKQRYNELGSQALVIY